jgi:phytoene dehydrogenase-like protein
MQRMDAVVVGSGPNGLAAAITIAQAGRKVLVVEAAESIGGGCRSAALTLPGFVHDVCSAVHPLAAQSPFFRSLPLASHGLQWIRPENSVAHPFDDGSVALICGSIERAASALDADERAYRTLFEWMVAHWPELEPVVLSPPRVPRHPLTAAAFGVRALAAAASFARKHFATTRARSVFAGVAAHGMLPLDMRPSAAFGLILTTMAHLEGWVLPRGGSQHIADALAAHLRALGGAIETGIRVESLDALPECRAVLCDLSPAPLLRIAGHRFPARYKRALERYRYGMGVFKMDWALDGPIPWRNADCARAPTVHLGGTLDQIAASENDAWHGRTSERPFVLLCQPTLFDTSRAPNGRHIAWAYCHVPRGSTADMSARIEQQIERCAPGFRDRVLARVATTPADLERRNPNLVGGDIAAGVPDLRQLFARPTWRAYSTPVKGLYLCSAATPPGVAVHGMCGYFAARRALEEALRD